MPDLIILDFKQELDDFRAVLNNVDLPTPDIEAVLSQLFDTIAVAEEDVYAGMVLNVAMDMAKGEGLYENTRLDEFDQQRIMSAVVKLCNKLKNKILSLNGYVDGFFQYSFQQLLDYNTVVLSKINEG